VVLLPALRRTAEDPVAVGRWPVGAGRSIAVKRQGMKKIPGPGWKESIGYTSRRCQHCGTIDPDIGLCCVFGDAKTPPECLWCGADLAGENRDKFCDKACSAEYHEDVRDASGF
jgi:hypothetical protein